MVSSESQTVGPGDSVGEVLGSVTTTAEPAFSTPDERLLEGERLAGTAGADESPLPRLFLLLIGIITVGGFLLRLPSFNDSLFGDEISTYFIVTGHSLGRVLRLVESNQETSPPLYFMLAWATKGILGSPVQSIRLVSLITGTAAIPLTFLLGLWTVGRRAALVGAACMALSPYMIFYSTEARPFMLMLFFTLLSSLALLRALDSRRNRWWVAYALCSCAAVYTHYTAVFLLVVQLAWAFWTQPQVRKYLVLANVAAVVAYIPWLNGLREDLHAPSFIGVLAPLKPQVVSAILETTWIGDPDIHIDQLPGRSIAFLAVAGLVVGAIGLILKVKGTRGLRWRPTARSALIALLALGPPTLLILYSWARTDDFGGPFLIASWPGLALLMGAVVSRPSRPLRIVAVTLLVGAYALSGAMMLGSAAQRPNVNAVVGYINRVGRNGDPIVSLSFFHNPISELDVAVANDGQSQHHPVLRLGAPPLAEQLAPLSGPNPQPGFFGLHVTPPDEVAAQAVALARNGTIFLVSYNTSLTVSDANDFGLLIDEINQSRTELREFLQALPARFHVVARITHTGFSGALNENLYVIRDTGSNQ